MKKFLALVLALAMVATLFTACGKKEEENPTDPTPVESQESDSEGESTEAVKVETVTEGKLTMATNAEFPPYEFYDSDNVVGIDAEVAAKIAEKLGMTLKIENVEFGSIVGGVESGKYDMGMAGMTVTEDRLKEVIFTDSYATGVQVVIVKEGSDIKSLDDIAGKKIGVQQGTTGDIYASDDFGEENVTKFANGALAVEGLKGDKVDCVIIDNNPAKEFVKANEGLVILDTAYAEEDYAAAISKDNPELTAAINAILDAKIADGSIQKIIDKYISAN